MLCTSLSFCVRAQEWYTNAGNFHYERFVQSVVQHVQFGKEESKRRRRRRVGCATIFGRALFDLSGIYVRVVVERRYDVIVGFGTRIDGQF